MEDFLRTEGVAGAGTMCTVGEENLVYREGVGLDVDGEVLATPLTRRLEGREEPRKGEEGLPKPDIIDM